MKEVIDRIISDFDFEKVHRVMVDLDWQWATTKGKVPSVGALVLCAQKLLWETSEMDVGGSIGTGGFRVTKTEEGEGLELEFILTSTEFCTKWLEEEKWYDLP